MSDTAPQHTISYLTKRFSEAGVRLNPRHGQNFLIDLNLLRLAVERAELSPNDVVLEVGAGAGSLTAMLAARAAAVVSVEIDPQLWQLASEELIRFPNVVLLQQDALERKSRLHAQVVSEVERQLAVDEARQLKLVANLPYGVATPVIANLLASQIVPRTMTVTVQKELADRMVAAPCTKDYGALSVWIQSQCHVELVRVLPPSVFWPRPQVHSAILHIEVDAARRARLGDRMFFHVAVRALFEHRRKLLRGVLHAGWKDRLDKRVIDELLQRQGIDPQARAEELSVDRIIELVAALRTALIATNC